MNKTSKTILYFLCLALLFITVSYKAEAAKYTKEDFPRLANYYLKWELSDKEAESLAKWDLLILDMEVQENSPSALRKIKKLNPDVIILAYITSQEIMTDLKYYHLAYLRPELKKEISSNWYLKDTAGNNIVNWPGTQMLNLSDLACTDANGRRFNDFLPDFVLNNIKSSGLWDGVFYDNTWGDLTWVANTNIDIDCDGKTDSAKKINDAWARGFKQMLEKTRRLVGNDFLIVGNGKIYEPYQTTINGMMFENFPAFWEGNGSWMASMQNYLKLPSLNAQPSIPVINTYNKNQNNFSLMRFGLASTLLGEGYYSYDYDTSNHTQLWWYDEYNFNLGKSVSSAYNPLNGSTTINNGFFRRDFENGSVFVNASNQNQIKIFSQETFSKLSGSQDPKINNGERVNYVALAPNTAIILSGKNGQSTKITNTSFTNGFFYRFFNGSGKQVRDSSFAFSSAHPGGSELIIVGSSTINGNKGQISINNNGQQFSFSPFPLFKGYLSLAITQHENKLDRIIVGAGRGGGPHILTFDAAGKLRANFFAYDKNLRTGVNVAAADVDGDGNLEIVTSPGAGTKPLVKVFDIHGNLKYSFLAYDENFRGGVSLAAGDMNNDGWAEIVTIPSSGGGPQVRVFKGDGTVIGGFFAFSKNDRDNFKIGLTDLNGDKNLSIIVGRENPY